MSNSPEIATRRVKMLMVDPAGFMALFTTGLTFRARTRIIDGIPKDARLLTIASDPIRGGIILVVESDEYEPVPINVQPPIIMVTIQTGGHKK